MTPHTRTEHKIVWTPERVKRFWDFEARSPQNYFTYQVGSELVRRLRPYLRASKEILDYGCGTGDLLQHLLRAGFSVTGTDYSNESIARVNLTYRGKSGFKGAFTIDNLLRTSNRFDAVLLIEVFEHLDDKALAQTLVNVGRLLQERGTLIVTVPNSEDLSLQTLRCPECGAVYHRYQHVRSWTAHSLSEFLRERQFEIVRCFATDLSRSWYQNRLRFAVRLPLALLKPRSVLPNLVCIAVRR